MEFDLSLYLLFDTKELNSEFLWLQKYIVTNELETQIEIVNDKIVFWAGKKWDKFIQWDFDSMQRFRNTLKSSQISFNYARYMVKDRFELIEHVIATDAYYSYHYAKDVIKERFELGEPVIEKDVVYSQQYQIFLKSL